MTNISISQLKTNPAKAIKEATDAPVGVQKRNKLEAYLVGSELFEKLVSYVEDYIDKKAVKEADYKKVTPLDDVIKELGLD